MVVGVSRVRVLRPWIVVPERDIARCDDLPGAAELGMVDIDSVVDHRNGNSLAERETVRGLDVRMRGDLRSIHGGHGKMPLLRRDGAEATLADHFGMTVFNIRPLQQGVRDIEYPGADPLGGRHEESVRCIVELTLDLQPRLLDHLPALLRLRIVDELDEEILRVHHRLSRGLIDQHSSGEAHIGKTPKRHLPFVDRSSPLRGNLVDLHTGFGKCEHQLTIVHLCGGGHADRTGTQRTVGACADGNEIFTPFQSDPWLVLLSEFHLRHNQYSMNDVGWIMPSMYVADRGRSGFRKYRAPNIFRKGE
jgi:hypothetical protein